MSPFECYAHAFETIQLAAHDDARRALANEGLVTDYRILAALDSGRHVICNGNAHAIGELETATQSPIVFDRLKQIVRPGQYSIDCDTMEVIAH